MIKRTHCIEVRVTVKMVYPVLIKVRAHTRVRFGKVEKVRSHYEDIGVSDVETKTEPKD